MHQELGNELPRLMISFVPPSAVLMVTSHQKPTTVETFSTLGNIQELAYAMALLVLTHAPFDPIAIPLWVNAACIALVLAQFLKELERSCVSQTRHKLAMNGVQ